MSTLTYPTRTAMTRNILREFRRTDSPVRAKGITWYAEALEIASTISLETGHALETSVGVIAALSPQQQWWQNVMLARQASEAGVMVQGHTTDNMRKVNEILQGADPLDVLGGLKVRSFYGNIISAGTDGGVTIDRHAWRTVCGRHELGQRSAVPTDKAYSLAVEAFQNASWQCGEDITAAQLQAIVWIPRAA